MKQVIDWLLNKGYRFSDVMLQAVAKKLYEGYCDCSSSMTLVEYLNGVEFSAFTTR